MANAEQPVNENVFCVGKNERGWNKVSHIGHISIEDLKIKIQDNESKIQNDFHEMNINYKLKILYYLHEPIPVYPTPVEFHVSEVTHVTTKNDLLNILVSEGFKAYDNEQFSWWSLKVDEESIKVAEEHYLEKTFPNRTQEQKEKQKPFLNKFTTSPAFDKEKSRYGNFRFTFPLNELMETYKNQMCGGQDPVLREYETTFFKKEILYVVLIHSPDVNEKFRNYPELKSSLIVHYKDEHLIWKAQAISDKLEFDLLLNEDNKIAETKPVKPHFYVWDNVALAFHFDGLLHFPKEKLEGRVTCCKIDYINLSRNDGLSLEEANEILQSYISTQ